LPSLREEISAVVAPSVIALERKAQRGTIWRFVLRIFSSPVSTVSLRSPLVYITAVVLVTRLSGMIAPDEILMSTKEESNQDSERE
jgi:hypothetical protein